VLGPRLTPHARLCVALEHGVHGGAQGQLHAIPRALPQMMELYTDCDGRPISDHKDETVAEAFMKGRGSQLRPPPCGRRVWKLMQACWAEPEKRPQFDAIAEELSRTLVGGVDPTHLLVGAGEDGGTGLQLRPRGAPREARARRRRRLRACRCDRDSDARPTVSAGGQSKGSGEDRDSSEENKSRDSTVEDGDVEVGIAGIRAA